ncbi:MAG TPA: nuclease-related domain-containing protein, partial [Bacillaceae bacterium]
MQLKSRVLSNKLRIFRFLDTRMNLSLQDKKHYRNIEKGYQGECIFDQLTSQLQSEVYILNDLCLEFNHSVFQIDTLIISQKTLFQIEIKNYEGDYKYESGEFRGTSSN